MQRFYKIIQLSKQIATALLKDHKPISLENSDEFDKVDKDYIISELTDDERIRRRQELSCQLDTETAWNKLRSKIDVPVRTLYWKYVAAAVVTGILVSGYLFTEGVFTNQNQHTTIDAKVVGNGIEAGTDKATLTLEDGSKVALEKGQQFRSNNLESNGEDLIYNPASDKEPTETTYNYLTIPRTGQYHVKLSDGTEVWLNSESQLKYPVQFVKGETRMVELIYGEAYFKVSSSANHEGAKFKVMTNSQDIEVLGTEFNVKAYSDEDQIYTTLIEGSIAIQSINKKTILNPNEQAILDKNANSLMVTSQVDAYSEVAWRRGLFSFKDKSLKEIMKVLSRWYDVDVEFENHSVEETEFIGVLSKTQNLNNILMSIQNFGVLTDFEITEKKVIIK